MLSFNALLNAALAVHRAEVARLSQAMRGAFHINEAKDFDSFITELLGEAPDDKPQKGSDINALIAQVGSF